MWKCNPTLPVVGQPHQHEHGNNSGNTSDRENNSSDNGTGNGTGSNGTNTTSVSVLMMGNSYTGANNLATLVDDVMDADGYNATLGSLNSGGMKLPQHWSNVNTSGNQWNTTLRGSPWDYVVLQDQVGPFLPVNQQHVAGQQERLGFTQRSDRRRGRRNGAVHDVGLPQRRQPQQFQQQFHRHAGSLDRRLHSLRREHFLRRSCCLDGPGQSGVQNRARRRRGGTAMTPPFQATCSTISTPRTAAIRRCRGPTLQPVFSTQPSTGETCAGEHRYGEPEQQHQAGTPASSGRHRVQPNRRDVLLPVGSVRDGRLRPWVFGPTGLVHSMARRRTLQHPGRGSASATLSITVPSDAAPDFYGYRLTVGSTNGNITSSTVLVVEVESEPEIATAFLRQNDVFLPGEST